MIEVTIKISNEEKWLKKRTLYEGDLLLSPHTPFIQSMIQDMIKEFTVQPDDVVVSCKMTC